MVEKGGSWRGRYNRSIGAETRRLRAAEAQESVWTKLVAKSTYTGSMADLWIVPIVLVVAGLSALARWVRKR